MEISVTLPRKGDHIKEIITRMLDLLQENVGLDEYMCDLPHDLMGTQYYIVGRYKAEQWLQNGPGVFEAIKTVTDYYEFIVGETPVAEIVTEPEQIVNMFVYITSGDIIAGTDTYYQNRDKKVSEDMLDALIAELKELIK
jgi:hypothetical protein